MKTLSIDEIKNKLTPIFTEYNVNEVILFGSYAKGLATAHSDVDLVIDTDIKGLRFFGLQGEMIDALKKDVELIPKRSIIPGETIDKVIQQEGVRIYGNS